MGCQLGSTARNVSEFYGIPSLRDKSRLGPRAQVLWPLVALPRDAWSARNACTRASCAGPLCLPESFAANGLPGPPTHTHPTTTTQHPNASSHMPACAWCRKRAMISSAARATPTCSAAASPAAPAAGGRPCATPTAARGASSRQVARRLPTPARAALGSCPWKAMAHLRRRQCREAGSGPG
eukprot:364500-Chlamydomonas_euryale.AAC.11